MIINPREEQWLRNKYPNQPDDFYESIIQLHGKLNGSLTGFKHDDGDLRLEYGFPNGLVTFYEIWNVQDRLCPICGKDLLLIRMDMHVDHDHISKLIYGIVHAGCNGLRRYDWRSKRGKLAMFWINMRAYEASPPALKVGRFYFNPKRHCTRSSITMEKHEESTQKVLRARAEYWDKIKQWESLGFKFNPSDV